jgi:hypothetical protein
MPIYKQRILDFINSLPDEAFKPHASVDMLTVMQWMVDKERYIVQSGTTDEGVVSQPLSVPFCKKRLYFIVFEPGDF